MRKAPVGTERSSDGKVLTKKSWPKSCDSEVQYYGSPTPSDELALTFNLREPKRPTLNRREIPSRSG